MKLFNFFKKEKETEKKEEKKLEVSVFSPIKGKLVDITNVPDSTFAEKMLGEGVAIIPEKSGEILSPVNGKIVQLFNTLHAFTIETKEGLNVLVHFGIDTVLLKQEGFTQLLSEGDNVKVGDAIVKYDLDLIIERGYNPITSVIILDSEEYDDILINFENETVDISNEIIKIKGK